MSDLIETLRLACDDPMWADHVEMPKKLLRHAVDYLDALKKQVEELTAERDALEVKAVSLLWAVPGETLCGEVQSLHKRALELQSAEAEAAALRKALIEARDVVDAVTGHNQPDRPWSRQVRDRIDAALASTRETSDA